MRRNAEKALWRQGLAGCLELRARIALAAGNGEAALSAAKQSVETLRSLHSGDKIKDAYFLADAWRLLGDAQRRRGDNAAAMVAWKTGAARLPANTTEQPYETAIRAQLLERLGRAAEAAAAQARLRSIGYRVVA